MRSADTPPTASPPPRSPAIEGATEDLRALDDLRLKVRAFFNLVLPEALAGCEGRLERARAWRGALYDAGFAGLGYPAEFGGHGGSDAEAAVYHEESRGRIPPEEDIFAIGVRMALPIVRDLGSPELKARFVRPGLSGEEIWCQLYSEPGAGSDLASLSTSALRDGDEWVINSQKVWTSGAQHSQMGILLARSDPHAPKHRGITMFVLPMEQPGVTVRPLRQMTGVAEFNEVFFDNARIPRSWVVGDVNDGWRAAIALLGYERVATGTLSVDRADTSRLKAGRVPIPVSQLADLAGALGRRDDPLVRQDLARLYSGEKIMGWLGRREVHPSIGKLWRTLQGRAAAQVAHLLALSGGASWEPDDADRDYFAYHILNCRAMSIGGGTDEIQRNTLAEKALGMPRDPFS